MNSNLPKQCVAEFIGTFTLIFVGVGAIYNLGSVPGGLLGIAFAHGLAIAVMASATGGISGGHLNPAVTFGLLVGGKVNMKTAIPYWVAQLAGATAAALLCISFLGVDAVKGGTPNLGEKITVTNGILIEAVLTFFLVFVVYGTAVYAHAPKLGGLAIGLTVTMDILFGGPLTGAAMNPARTFGPALAASQWANHIVYWIGPLLGGAVAGLICGRFLDKETHTA